MAERFPSTGRIDATKRRSSANEVITYMVKRRRALEAELKEHTGKESSDFTIDETRALRGAKQSLKKRQQEMVPGKLEREASAAREKQELMDKLLKADMSIVVEDPFLSTGEDVFKLPPPLDDDSPFKEHDLLTESGLKEIARCVVEDQLNAEIAAMSVGIPCETFRAYVDRGKSDLAAGIPTRFAVAAKVAMMAEYAVIKETARNVRRLPVGWQNSAWFLERLHPHLFSEKRVSKKETDQASQLAALQKQLGQAMASPNIALPPLKEEH